MNRIIRHISFLALALGLFALSSCMKNETCLSSNNLLVTDLYTVNEHGVIIKSNIDSMSMYIIGREDTLIYNNVKNIGSFNIPMADTLEYLQILLTLNGVQDTIKLDYRTYEVFRSANCGVINRYEIKANDNSENNIRQIVMINNQIDESKSTNFFLYYRSH